MTALIFDCDGVLADTERDGHRVAFNRTFEEFGLPVRWSEDEYGAALKIAGGKERMASLLTPAFVERAGLPTDEDGQREAVASWHRRKTEIYTEMVAEGRLPARPGVARIASRRDRRGLVGRGGLDLVRGVGPGGPRARRRRGARRLGSWCWPATSCRTRSRPPTSTSWRSSGWTPIRRRALVIEDSRNGLLAAVGAGLYRAS